MTSTVTPITDKPESLESIPTTIIERQVSNSQHDRGTRVPKRILHFCDGTLEEYSSEDENDGIEVEHTKRTCRELNTINPATLTWIPWIMYQTTIAGTKALSICDFFGEYLANFFGIITPKYEYEIEHYKRMIEEEKEKKKQDIELGGWAQSKTDQVISEQQRTAES